MPGHILCDKGVRSLAFTHVRQHSQTPWHVLIYHITTLVVSILHQVWRKLREILYAKSWQECLSIFDIHFLLLLHDICFIKHSLLKHGKLENFLTNSTIILLEVQLFPPHVAVYCFYYTSKGLFAKLCNMALSELYKGWSIDFAVNHCKHSPQHQGYVKIL